MKKILIILSILILSSVLISCTENNPSPVIGDNPSPVIGDNLSPVIRDDHKGETLYRWGDVCCDYKWMGFGDKDLHPKYRGQVKNVKPNGLGIMIEPNGSKYVGSWKDGVKHGQGTFTSPFTYKNVQGTFTTSNGSRYEGEWKNGKKDGQGTITWSDGEKYEGEWKDSEMWSGIFYDKNGNIVGHYVNAKMRKQ